MDYGVAGCLFTHGLERFMAGNRCAKNKRTSSEQMLCTGSQEQRLVRVGEGSLTFSHHRAALAPWEGDRDTVLLTSKAVFPQRPHSAGASLAAEFLKNLPAVQETGFNCWVGKIPWRRKWQPTASVLAWRIPWTKEPGKLQSPT